MKMQIGNLSIGRGRQTVVIAEIGVNHDGSVERALRLVDIARECGADAIKLQIFRAEQLMHPSAGFAEYQRDRVADRDPIEMLRRYELSDDDIARIVERARSLDLLPIATPFSMEDVSLIEKLHLPAIKIASPDIVNRPLIRRALHAKKPLLISTGAATIGEVDRCLQWCADASVALLHCISSYPVSVSDAHLAWIADLARRFAVPIGYSDHTTSEIGGAMAVASGACFVEKHLTYDTNAAGPDHSASADPDAFARYVKAIRQAEQSAGNGGKRVLPIEADVRNVSRQSLVLNRAVHAGECITVDALVTQRPGTGISAADVDTVVGQSAACDLPAGTMLQWEMLSSAVKANAA